LRISEDQDLYLKMYEKGDVKFINDTNYLYRTHAGGISQNENKRKSYEYWAKVIWNTMQRRGLKNIHGQRIPEKFTGSEEVFRLIEYQNSFFYRLRRKISKVFYRLST
ncbi:MAG: glycosyltransferase family 2 protein, partial [Kaistella sp.]